MSFSQQSDRDVRRKAEHLKIVADNDVCHSRGNLLDEIHLVHQALPELDFDEVTLDTTFFGRKLAAPMMIVSMTGGVSHSEKLNAGLAAVAAKYNIAFAVGSQRVMLKYPETTAHFAVRRFIPDGVLLGNIGAVQLQEFGPEKIAGLVERIEGDGICVHLNAAQEMIQQEGHRTFRGIADKIAELNDYLDGRVLVKESGAGLSPGALKRLGRIGIKYIDVAGSGGTSWTKVESYRAPLPMLKKAGDTFADWGVPTAFSLLAARKILDKDTCLIASGGIENGLDIARALAAGADIGGFARSILLHFLDGGEEAAGNYLESLIYELKTAMLLTGSKDIVQLREAPRHYGAPLKAWLDEFDQGSLQARE